MHEVRIVNSIAEINREQLKDGKENSQQEINEFVHEMVKKYEQQTEVQEKKIVARKIRQEQYFNKLAQQKSDRQYLSQPCTEEGQLFQFSVAELIFGEGGIL